MHRLYTRQHAFQAIIIALGLLMALALGLATWSAYHTVNATTPTLLSGHSERLMHVMDEEMRTLQRQGRQLDHERLYQVAERMGQDGMTHLAVYSGVGKLMSVGEPRATMTHEAVRELPFRIPQLRGELAVYGSPHPALEAVLGMESGPPRGAPPERRGPPPERRGPPDAHHGPPGARGEPPERGAPPHPPHERREDIRDAHGMRPIVLIEFIPHDVQRVQAEARRVLAFGIIGALVILLGTLALVWLIRKREAAEAAAAERRQLALLGEMSATLAHELRNPLASAKGHAQLLAELLEPQPRSSAKAQRVVDELVRIETLIHDLLDFVRSGRLNRQETDPKQLLGELTNALSVYGPVTLHTAEAPDQWPLDPARMEQVLINLVRNAQQASPEGVPVVVTAREHEHELIITVRDRGEGISPGLEEAIFTPFLTTRTRGTGLGLAVTRQIVEAHGGSITACNMPDGGACFRVTIPP